MRKRKKGSNALEICQNKMRS
jgi:hypothetical protein